MWGQYSPEISRDFGNGALLCESIIGFFEWRRQVWHIRTLHQLMPTCQRQSGSLAKLGVDNPGQQGGDAGAVR